MPRTSLTRRTMLAGLAAVPIACPAHAQTSWPARPVHPNVTMRFAQLNIDIHEMSPEEFGSFVQGQMERWGKVVKEANIRLG